MIWDSLAFLNLVVARLAYVIVVGIILKRQDERQEYTLRYGIEGGYNRFKRISSVLMLYDGAAFILLNLVTIDTLHLPVPRIALVVFGLAIGIFGIVVKSWAAATLGTQHYYWYNFFEPSEPVMPNPPGPYKYIKNPMYGVGYLQTYGLGFLCASWPGLVASVFMQASIFVFNIFVERPHYRSLLRQFARQDQITEVDTSKPVHAR